MATHLSFVRYSLEKVLALKFVVVEHPANIDPQVMYFAWSSCTGSEFSSSNRRYRVITFPT